MSKVIVERPRRQGYDGNGHKRGRRVDEDLLLNKESMRARHVRNWGGKELNENLAPLVRFLRSRLGRRWDDVYSEISQNLRVTSAVQQHVKDHVWDFVSTRTKLVDGNIWVSGTHGFHPLEKCWRVFYVDPADGLLKENPSYKNYIARRRRENTERLAAQQAVLKVAQDGTEYRKIDGVWYEMLWAQVPPPRVRQHVDATTGRVSTRLEEVTCFDAFTNVFHHVPGERYRCGKRQIGRPELRRLGLSNDQP